MSPTRWIPLLVMTLGIGYGAVNYPRVKETIENKVKTLLTGYELGKIRDALLSHVATGGHIPSTQESLQRFLASHLGGRDDRRGMGQDLWGYPYRMEEEDPREHRYLLYSTGPDGVEDCCTNLEEHLRQVETMAAGYGRDGQEPMNCNDVCLVVRLIYREQTRGIFRPIP